MKGRPRKIESPEALQQAFDEYMAHCATFTKSVLSNSGKLVDVPTPRVPTVGEFCRFIKMERHTLDEYALREGFSATIKSIHAQIHDAKQIALLNGEGNTTGIIFDLKCNHGWKDKTTIEHEGEITVTMNLTQ
jgi:hypothetical protein